MQFSTSFVRTAALLVATALTACSSSSDPAPAPSPTPPPLVTLSGVVQSAGQTGLAGARVSALEGTVLATTDSGGRFVLYGPLPNGPVSVRVDTSTAAGGPWPSVVSGALVDGDDNSLSQRVVLPDLGSAAVAIVLTDASGLAAAPIQLTDGPDLELSGAAGTLLTLDGVPAASTSVELRLAAVPPSGLPAPLPAGLVAVSCALLDPADVGFDPPAQGPVDPDGLDLALPNPLAVPLGEELDVWAFDGDTSTWVDRSQATGERATVVSDGGSGTRIEASGVVAGGAWYAFVMPIHTDCTYTLTGRVVELLDKNAGIPRAAVALDTGQFTVSDDDGYFTIEDVAAYVIADALEDPPVATPRDLSWTVTTPVEYGSTIEQGTLLAGVVAPGGTLSFKVRAVATYRGVLVGRMSGEGASGASEPVVVTSESGGAPLEFVPEGDGSWFGAELATGTYLTSYAFAVSPDEPAVEELEVEALRITRSSLTESAEVDLVDVLVVYDADGDLATPGEPRAGARVTLVGVGAGPGGGDVVSAQTTDDEGLARFYGATGPFTVTAQVDVESLGAPNRRQRYATTLVGLEPVDGLLSVPIFGGEGSAPPGGTAMLQVALSNTDPGPHETVSLYVFRYGAEPGDALVAAETGLVDGTTFVQVPPDETLAVFATVVSTGGPGLEQVTRFLGVTGLGPLGMGASVPLDLDFDEPGVVDVAIAVPLEFGGSVPGAAETTVALTLTPGDGLTAALPLARFDATPVPVTLLVPDFTSGGAAALGPGLAIESASDAGQSACRAAFATTPTSVEFHLLSPAQIDSPTEGQEVDLMSAKSLVVSATGAVGDVPPGGSGANLVRLTGRPHLDPSVRYVNWTLWLPADTSSVQLPHTSWPMLDDSPFLVAFERFRTVGGASFDYETFFDADVVAKLVALGTSFEEQCSAESELFIELYTPLAYSVDHEHPPNAALVSGD